jgi:acetoin utilization deacetylase AcuC-like enzyme/GNAT superfamily N-acetyltransferase
VFRIRRIMDDVMPGNKVALNHVQNILETQFKSSGNKETVGLEEKLRNPFKQRFVEILFVAEQQRSRIMGFALMMHDPEIRFTYLDYIASERGFSSRGVGGALYEHVRDQARILDSRGLFFECAPDDEDQYSNSEDLKNGRARLRFYERYGARPIMGTDYQRPIKPTDTCMPYLVYDSLGKTEPLSKKHVRRVVRAILERKYAELCSPDYVEAVVGSVNDDPVAVRPFRYVKPKEIFPDPVRPAPYRPFFVVVNDKHEIHHVKDRGYVEAPVRVARILGELRKNPIFEEIQPERFSMKLVSAVHDPGFLDYLKRACAGVEEGKSIYPYVFPVRNKARPPREMTVRAGYYCIDTFTPINANAWLAARRAVDCTLTAADQLLRGWRTAYALVRPPGHHAEQGLFGGFCYLNNAAIAAERFSAYGKVAILDLDYHHGNGQQSIFYKRPDVLTVSIHGHPQFAYPYFSGFAEETGEDEGKGYNLNLPMPENLDGEGYRKALKKALGRIRDFSPELIVLALGLDTARLDPTGTWSLDGGDLHANGRLVGAMGLPVLVVQEGGYRTRTLGSNAAAFLTGLHEANP